eukprot:5438709-Amphidinium_carterae.1
MKRRRSAYTSTGGERDALLPRSLGTSMVGRWKTSWSKSNHLAWSCEEHHVRDYKQKKQEMSELGIPAETNVLTP